MAEMTLRCVAFICLSTLRGVPVKLSRIKLPRR